MATIIGIDHVTSTSHPATIFNAHDPMQNSGQTRIFHKAGQICLTWTKRDQHDLDNLDNPTWFQP